MKRWQAIIVFIIGAASFGFNPIFVKLGFSQGYTLAEVNVIQMTIAVLFLWGVSLFKLHHIKMLTKRNICMLMVSGSFTGLTSVFYYGSMQYLPASIAIILLFQFVWIGVIFEWIFDKRAPNMQTIISVILTLIGVLLAADIISGEIIGMPLMGILLGFCGAFSYAGFIYVSGHVATNVDPILRAPLMITGSFILILLIFPPTFFTWELVTSSVWLYGIGVAFCGAILPPLLFAISSPYLSGGFATVLGSIELPVAVIMARLILGESVTFLQWLGILLIIMAVSINEVRAFIRKAFMEKKTVH